MLEALKAGAQVFKTMSQESGLTIDNVEKIMGEVEDVCVYDREAYLNVLIVKIGNLCQCRVGIISFHGRIVNTIVIFRFR